MYVCAHTAVCVYATRCSNLFIIVQLHLDTVWLTHWVKFCYENLYVRGNVACFPQLNQSQHFVLMKGQKKIQNDEQLNSAIIWDFLKKHHQFCSPVLDAMAGFGTVTVVALSLDCPTISVEIDPDQVSILF